METIKRLLIISILILTITNIYSQNNSSTYNRIIDNQNIRNKKISEFILNNNLQKNKIYNGKTYTIYDIVDDKPIYRTTDNLVGSLVTKANHLQVGGSLGLNLQGSDITVGVWDGGPVQDTHDEFQNSDNTGSRIINYDQVDTSGISQVDDHATHVSGTIAAKGVEEDAQGMATNVNVATYNFNGDTGKMIGVQGNEEIDVFLSNHSYGIPINQGGGSTLDSWWMGAYSGGAREVDAIAADYPYYLMVYSAGNSGTTNYPGGLYSGYDKLTDDKNSKNNLVVANANASVNPFSLEVTAIAINGSSSQGPTDDLRIKPDITGYGSGVLSTVSGDGYASFSGTSMSAPNVTGSLVLIQEHYMNLNEVRMKSATLKGLVCHTAEDDIITSGPDPKFGWGVLDSKKSAELISDDQSGDALIAELNLQNNDTYQLNFNVTGDEKLIATICWTDVPGVSVSGDEFLNDSTPRLVNDLDIRLEKDGTTYYPWSLVYSTSGFSNTNTVDNYVDNVEKIEIDTPEPGSYTLTVSHKDDLQSLQAFGGTLEQDFSLIISGSNFSSTLGNSSIDSNKNLMIWPNPVNDILNFSFLSSSDSDAIINLYDSRGRVVYKRTKESINNNISDNIDISNLSSGFYILSIRHGESIVRKKIIKN